MKQRMCPGCGEPADRCREKWAERAAHGRRVPASREVLEEEIQRMFARAAEMAEVDQRAARHEASHAYSVVRLGYPLTEVALGQPGHGHTHTAITDRADALLVAAAGGAAERHFYGDDAGSDADDEVIAGLLDYLPTDERDAIWIDANRHADMIVAFGEQPIEALAEVLLRRRRVDGADVRAILGEYTEAGGVPSTRRSNSQSTRPWFQCQRCDEPALVGGQLCDECSRAAAVGSSYPRGVETRDGGDCRLT